jgi:hypothetical protein
MSCAVWRVQRRPGYREDLDAIEAWVAHENYVVYFDQHEADCTLVVRAVVHVARQFPPGAGS